MTPTEKIRANAELVVGQLRQASGMDDFGYNPESVAWLDGFIERQRARPEFDEEAAAGLSQTLGSFLGECVVRCYGGQWREFEGSWAVAFDSSNAVFPFNKVRKHLANGESDSVRRWFETIPLVFARQPAAGPPRRKKAWWKFGR